jgi:radical SAM protein
MSLRPAFDFNRAPFIVIWEVTRACDLACQHCRADAQPDPSAQQLTTTEGMALLDHVREHFGVVLMVFTGGDPLKRPDLHQLIAHGTRLGLRMAITPSATPLLTAAAIGALQDSGIKRIALSLDGADAATHDAFRGVPGTFARTIDALNTARRLGLEIQVNTTVSRHNIGQLEQIARMVEYLDARLWSVFALVATGRAAADLLPTPLEHEQVYRLLAALALEPATSFDIKTTAGQPYYRVLAQRRAAALAAGAAGESLRTPGNRAPRTVNDGNGLVFISHTGEISPSGFLPLVAGTVRTASLADVYRQQALFVRLRQPETFSGKCGWCSFQQLCGGSRSRAFAATGDAFASDPTCIHQPKRQLQGASEPGSATSGRST